jgi:hypothetical protein
MASGERTWTPERVVALVVPLAWVALAFTSGDAIADALDGRSTAVQVVGAAGAWGGWAATLVALLVPRTSTLTAARLAVPAALPVTVAAVVAAGEASPTAVAGLALAAALLVAVLSAPVGARFANGSSYGDEQRFLLRPPLALVAGPVELLWAVMVTTAVAGPLLLAAEQWVAGGIVAALAAGTWWFGVRSLHGLARRWVVLVPAGLVLHDPTALLDTVLVQRGQLARLGPADADTTATDLTLGAAGLALELELTAPTEVLALTARGFGASAVEARPGLEDTTERLLLERILFTPSRPGALLRAARGHRLPIA